MHSAGLKVGSIICIAFSIISTEFAKGPTQSKELDGGYTPSRLTRPKVGFKPKTPQHAAGIRIEPPVSVPRVKSACFAATAAAEPLEEPPGISSGYLGLIGVPKAWLMPVIPKANSCKFVLPIISQSAFKMFLTTSASSCAGSTSNKALLPAMVFSP
ncbi:Uncharacterised protein [Acinetobacter baumannii]|nr:Uncharacterised protein [Acinetobacter baumannii]